MADRRTPYQGLGFYTEADAKWFFGRTNERKVILAHLRTARLTLLYAESGVGKSSLLRAGVVARLKELAARSMLGSRSRRFVPVVFSAWKDDPVQDLIAEIERQARPFYRDAPAPTASGNRLADAISASAAAIEATLVIILDQFEEHFSYRHGESQPDRLADELAQCINSPQMPANFLIAVREDVYGRLGDLFSGRISNVYDNYLHLEYLGREAAREAIEKPVELYNAVHPDQHPVALDPDLADALLDEVRRGNIELGARPANRNGATRSSPHADEIETPFLQLVMTRLWDAERSHGSPLLRTSTLNDELGGAESIVRSHVDRALAGLADQELETATDIFHDLVTPSGAKVAHTAEDLAAMTRRSPDTVAAVLRTLYDERIVRAVDPAPGTSEARYEIFHDRLAAPILDWRRQQENARLDRARRRAEQEARTQRTQARRFKRRARITLGLAVGMLALLVGVIVLWQYARDQSATAGREKRAATYSGLTTQAQSQLSSRPDVSLLLYLAAYKERPQAITERRVAATLESLQRSEAVGVLHGHTDSVESIAFSRVNSTLASVSSDGTIRLWTVTPSAHYPQGQPLRPGGPLYSVAFDAAGRVMAAGGSNNITLWDTARHAELVRIPYRSGAVNSVALNATGQLLAAGGSDGTVLLWNTATHRGVRWREPGASSVRSVAFNRSGKILATSGATEVRLWDVASHRELGRPLDGPPGGVFTIAFSPNGNTLAAAGDSPRILAWDLAQHERPLPSLVVGKPVFSIAFSPDGRALAAGNAQRTLLWRLAGRHWVKASLSINQGSTYGVAFSPDGRMLASGGAGRTISLWNYPLRHPTGTLLLRRPDRVTSVAVSPDDSIVASGGSDGSVLLSARRSGSQLRVLRGPNPVRDVAFDPNGRMLAVSYDAGPIRLWNAATGAQLGLLRGRLGRVYSVAFSPNGETLVSGGVDGRVRFWNLRTFTEIGPPLLEHSVVYTVAFSRDGDEVGSAGDGRVIRLWNAHTHRPLALSPITQDASTFSLAFSPSGGLLAAGGADDAIHLWDLRTPTHISSRTLVGDSGFVTSVAVSPDGRTLASGSSDATVRLWDVATATELGAPLTDHRAPVQSVAFSTDGRFVVSGSIDHTVRVWQAAKPPSAFATLRTEVCNFLGAGLSKVEWAKYAPEISYEPVCPRATPS